jgi:hypothetical protein
MSRSLQVKDKKGQIITITYIPDNPDQIITINLVNDFWLQLTKYGELGRDGKILFSVAATIHLNLFKIDKRRL